MKHLIICGSYRAGTSITAFMLSKHSELIVTDEMWYYFSDTHSHIFNDRIKRLSDKYPNLKGRPFIKKSTLKKNYKSFLDEMLKKYPNMTKKEFLKALIKHSKKKAKYYGDKLPEYVQRLEKLNKEFNKPKVIMCIRDPRDVICSQVRKYQELKKKFGSVGTAWWTRPTADDCIKMKRSWLYYIKKWKSSKNKLDSYELQYNKMVDNKEKEAKRISDFLGINTKEMQKIFNKYFKPTRHKEWVKKFPNINDKLPEEWKKIMKEYRMYIK